MQFFELLGLEVEVLALTRDTTESDLKQRRELLADGTAVWVDQAPVRAALRGRVLLLDGLERAERNVLPTLNNLLEAREMALEDGRLIISQERALAFTAHVQQPEPGLDIALEPEPGGSSVRVLPSGMVAADPGFWVVSLASPCPPYPGKPLDPPLRSRFHSRWVDGSTETAGRNRSARPTGDAEPATTAAIAAAGDFAAAARILHSTTTITPASEAASPGAASLAGASARGMQVPLVPRDTAEAAARLFSLFPSQEALDPAQALQRLYPAASSGLQELCPDDSSGEGIYTTLAAALPGGSGASRTRLVGSELVALPGGSGAGVRGSRLLFEAARGAGQEAASKGALWVVPVCPDAPAHSAPRECDPAAAEARGWVSWDAQEDAVASMARDLCAGLDLAVVGPPGCGKTMMVRELCQRAGLGWPGLGVTGVSLIPIHSEMTARDLLATRETGADGATRWKPSALVEAAVRGHTVVLDGVHRLPPDTLASVLGSLLGERLASLPEGSILAARGSTHVPDTSASHESAEDVVEAALAQVGRLSEASLASLDTAPGCPAAADRTRSLEPACGLLPVHPAFRVIIIGEAGTASARASAGAGLGSAVGALRAVPWLHPELLGSLAVHVAPRLSARAGSDSAGTAEDDFLHSVIAQAAPHATAQGISMVQNLGSIVLSRQVPAGGAKQAAASTASGGKARPPPPPSLSVRQLVRIARRLPREQDGAASDEDSFALFDAVGRAVWDTTLAQFGPVETREALHRAVVDAAAVSGVAVPADIGAQPFRAAVSVPQAQLRVDAEQFAEALQAAALAWPPAPHTQWDRTGTNKHTRLRTDGIASATASLGGAERVASVRVADAVLPVLGSSAVSHAPPSSVYVDSRQHSMVLRDMIAALAAGERAVSLIGNQGAGKNRIAIHLLLALNRQHTYMQLHRDTTVSQLTCSPSLEAGKLVWSDSPLIRAAVEGQVALVDECDKAPTEVLAVIKALLEGCVRLPDGRTLTSAQSAPQPSAAAAGSGGAGGAGGAGAGGSVVSIHPAFRLIALANRPGWPFLGNDFHASVGDLCSTVVVGALTQLEELEILSHAGPGVSREVLAPICAAFADLRAWHESGRLSYPFSLREAVGVAEHLSGAPQDGAAAAVRSVVAFDSASPEARGLVERVFADHGIVLTLGDTAAQDAAAAVAGAGLGSSIQAPRKIMIERTGPAPDQTRRLGFEPAEALAGHDDE